MNRKKSAGAQEIGSKNHLTRNLLKNRLKLLNNTMDTMNITHGQLSNRMSRAKLDSFVEKRERSFNKSLENLKKISLSQ